MHNIIEQRSLWPGLDCPSSGNFVEDHHLQKTLKGRWVVTGGIQGAWDAHKSHKEYLNCWEILKVIWSYNTGAPAWVVQDGGSTGQKKHRASIMKSIVSRFWWFYCFGPHQSYFIGKNYAKWTSWHALIQKYWSWNGCMVDSRHLWPRTNVLFCYGLLDVCFSSNSVGFTLEKDGKVFHMHSCPVSRHIGC